MSDDDWRKVVLGDLIRVKHGWAFKSKFFSERLSGRPVVVAVGNFRYEGGFRFEETKTKEYRGEYPKDYELSPGDILLVMTCQTAGGEILGIPARVPSNGYVYLHNQRLGKVVIKNRSQLDENFLYWLFLYPEFNRHLFQTASGTKILHTAPDRIEAFTFWLPPLHEQQAVAHILSTLDDKIELIRRMNETLETIARVIFKSWFVDFEPIPGIGPHKEWIDSAVGKIPKGWRLVRIGELASRVSMGPFGSRITRDNFVDNGVPVIRGTNLVNGFNEDNFVYLTENKADELKSANAFPGDLVFTHRGTLGQVGLIPLGSRYPRYVVSQSQMLLSVDHSEASPEFLYRFFCSHQGQQALLANTNTTGVPAIARPSTSLKAIQLVLPPREISNRFDEIACPLAAKQYLNNQESRTLSSIRDTLLPNLLSGEIRIKDAEKFVGRAV